MTAYERGWSKLKDGELLDEAEKKGFEVLVTTEFNLRYQRNLQVWRIAIIALATASWPRIQHAIPVIVLAVNAASPGATSK